MFYVRRPTPQQIALVLAEQRQLEPDYIDTGLSHPERELLPPRDWSVDRHCVCLGEGETVFAGARAGLLEWHIYNNGWTSVFPQTSPQAGATFIVTAQHFGFYSLNAVRDIYLLDEPDRVCFAVAALPLYAERGEERFMVWQDTAGKVWFELLAVSTPKNALVKLASPLARTVQRRFFNEAEMQMLGLVNRS